MRLIDLDQTIFVPIVDESNGSVEYEMEMSIGEMFDKFLDGFQPEIVDAVPVEWLEYMQQECLAENDRNMVNAIEAILIEWHVYVHRLREMRRRGHETD